MNQAIENFRKIVETEYARLCAMPNAEAGLPPAPGRWSPKQVIGHLIDSASNNHGRFVRAQFTNDLVFDGYDQERWVEFADYQNSDWKEMLVLWRSLNLQIARIMEQTPDDVLKTPRQKHNLHVVALHAVPENEPATLEYFMLDYIEHLEQHLRQIAS